MQACDSISAQLCSTPGSIGRRLKVIVKRCASIQAWLMRTTTWGWHCCVSTIPNPHKPSLLKRIASTRASIPPQNETEQQLPNQKVTSQAFDRHARNGILVPAVTDEAPVKIAWGFPTLYGTESETRGTS